MVNKVSNIAHRFRCRSSPRGIMASCRTPDPFHQMICCISHFVVHPGCPSGTLLAPRSMGGLFRRPVHKLLSSRDVMLTFMLSIDSCACLLFH